jgi:hypothetical protein
MTRVEKQQWVKQMVARWKHLRTKPEGRAMLAAMIRLARAQQQTEPTPKPEPCRRAFSREEMIEEAKAYMRETWGPCRESEDRDRWHERLGMLVDFIHDRFPQGDGGQ